jgi:hypothetical protein
MAMYMDSESTMGSRTRSTQGRVMVTRTRAAADTGAFSLSTRLL